MPTTLFVYKPNIKTTILSNVLVVDVYKEIAEYVTNFLITNNVSLEDWDAVKSLFESVLTIRISNLEPWRN